jgi:hypothetical protein
MHLLIALGLWVAASIPLALVLGRAMRASGRSGGLIEEIEGYLRRQTPGARSLRHAGGLVFAATLVAALALLGNEAVQQLPAAQVVADRLLANVTTTTTAVPSPARSSPGPSAPPARHARHRPTAATAGPAPADAAFPTFDQPTHEEGRQRPADAAVDEAEDGPTTTTSTTVPDDDHRVERDRRDEDEDHRGPDDGHHGKDDGTERDRKPTPTTTTTSTSTTSTTTPTTPTTGAGSTPAGSTTTAPSTTTTTEPARG